jgi:uncharacterized damage-inducible protein DinB
MVTPEYLRAMSAYNAEMNRRLYDAAARLPDAERRRDRGAFFRSIHGTFNHLLWADRLWMHRFDGWQNPNLRLRDSAGLVDDFAELRAAREQADAGMQEWAARVDASWLAEEQTWLSRAAGGDLRRPRTLLVMHLFNHQTHHRGQAHAMLTAAGERTGDTDIVFIL